jgi:methionyl-tRNA synthetase
VQDLKPWDMIKVKPEEAGSIIAGAIGLVALLAAVAEPFMPSITRKVAFPPSRPNLLWPDALLVLSGLRA